MVFKDRAACLTSRLVLPSGLLCAGPPSTSGALLLFQPPELVNFDFASAFSSPSSLLNPPSGFVLPFRGGARLLPLLRLPRQPVSVFCSTTVYRYLISGRFSVQRRTASLLPSGGGAASTSSPRPPSTATGDLFNLSVPSRHFRAELLSRSRGRGFYHRRVGCQPTSLTSVFPPRARFLAKGAGSLPPQHLLVKSFLIR